MTSEQIKSLVENRHFPGRKDPVEQIETHISWVILTPDFAFKIKKPVQFSFLDFSTSEKREFFCEEEFRLNRRLAPEIYLGVLPITQEKDGVPRIGSVTGELLDHAVWMKRMDSTRQMDKLLQQNAVQPTDMVDLAGMLAKFHGANVLPEKETGYQAGDNLADFGDLDKLETAFCQIFGTTATQTLAKWRDNTTDFLEKHEPRLRARAEQGFWVEGHGDLHGRNIFLLPGEPLAFDCIEFNVHFRKLDVLSELAFLCVDLDAGSHHELEKTFMDAYLKVRKCIETSEDERIFQYFKAYRANVRLKIALLEWQQHQGEALEKTAKVYHDLLDGYLAKIVLTADTENIS